MNLLTDDYIKEYEDRVYGILIFKNAFIDESGWNFLARHSQDVIYYIAFQNCHNVADERLEILKNMNYLKGVYVCGCNLNGSFIRYLKGRKLEALVYRNNQFAPDNIKYLRDLRSARILCFANSGVDESIFDEISSLQPRCVDISGVTFNRSTRSLRCLSELSILSLRKCKNVGVLLPHLNQLKNLRSLDLSDVNLSHEDAMRLCYDNLYSLSLEMNAEIDDSIFQRLSCSHITDLYLGGTNMTFSGLSCCESSPLSNSLADCEFISCPNFFPDPSRLLSRFPKLRYIMLNYSKQHIRRLRADGYDLSNQSYIYHPDNNAVAFGAFKRSIRSMLIERDPIWNPRLYFNMTADAVKNYCFHVN